MVNQSAHQIKLTRAGRKSSSFLRTVLPENGALAAVARRLEQLGDVRRTCRERLLERASPVSVRVGERFGGGRFGELEEQLRQRK